MRIPGAQTRRLVSVSIAMAGLLTPVMRAQAAQAVGNPVDVRSQTAIDAQARTLLAEAQKSSSGTAGVTFERYPGQITMLTVRTKSGGAEIHADWNDFFIVEDGEATVLTGGTMVDAKETAPGETRGSRLEGATAHVIRKGDVMHIAPGIPHQTTVAPGRTFTYYVIKVAVPKT